MANENSLVVYISGDSSEVEATLKKATRSLKDFEKDTQKASKAMMLTMAGATKSFALFSVCAMGVTQVAGSVFSSVQSLVGSFTEFGKQMDLTSRRTDIAVSDLSRLRYAADQTGTDFETLADAIKTFQEQIGAVKLGDAGTIDKLKAVGIDAKDFEGLDSQETFLRLADHISQIKDSAEQTRVAIELFGDSGYMLLPLFQKGSAGINELCREAEKLGLVMDDAAIQKSRELETKMLALQGATSALGRSFMEGLAEPLTTFAQGMSGVVKWVGGFIEQNPRLVKAASATAVALTAVGATVAAVTTVATVGLGPALATLAVGAVAFATTWKSAGETLEDTRKKALESANQEREADQKKMERLKDLSRKEKISNADRVEAQRLVAELSKRYGDLGLSVDKATGKVHGLTQAQRKMVEEARRQKLSQVSAALREERANLHTLRTTEEGFFSAVGDYWTGSNSHEERKRAIRASSRKIQELKLEQSQLTVGGSAFTSTKGEKVPTYGVLSPEEAARQAEKRRAQTEEVARIEAELEAQRERTFEERKADLKEEATRRDALLEVERRRLEVAKRHRHLTEEEAIRLETIGKTRERLVAWYLAELGKIEKEEEAIHDLQVRAAQEQRAAVAEERREQASIRATLLQMEKEFSTQEATEQEKGVEAIREKNRAYLDQLSLLKDISAEEIAEARRVAKRREDDYIQKSLEATDEVLDGATGHVLDAQHDLTLAKVKAMGAPDAPAPKTRREKVRTARSQAQKEEEVAKAEAELRDALKEYREDAFKKANGEFREAEKNYIKESKKLEKMEEEGVASDEELMKQRNATATAKKTSEEKRIALEDAYAVLAPPAFEKGDFVGAGTFSAFGIDALSQSNIPKDTLDEIRKIRERVDKLAPSVFSEDDL